MLLALTVTRILLEQKNTIKRLAEPGSSFSNLCLLCNLWFQIRRLLYRRDPSFFASLDRHPAGITKPSAQSVNVALLTDILVP
jgi:hypothetical protein